MDRVRFPNSLLQEVQESFLQGQRKRHKSSPVDDGQELYFGSSNREEDSDFRFEACFNFKPKKSIRPAPWLLPPTFTDFESEHAWYLDGMRLGRADTTRPFRRDCKSVVGRKCCVSDGCVYALPSAKCFHLTWVAVHGPESICMVTWHQTLDLERVDPKYHDFCEKERNMCDFGATVISEVECIPYDDADYNDDRIRLAFGSCIKTPFAVVSVVPDTNEVPKTSVREGSSLEYDVSSATTFFKEKFRSGLDSSIEETIVTAISGFQHLCRKELEAEDIWVTVLTPSIGAIRHLHLDKRKEYLAVIKGGLPFSGVGITSDLAPYNCSFTNAIWVYYLNCDESSTSESHDQSRPTSLVVGS